MINKGFALARGMTWRAGVDKGGVPPPHFPDGKKMEIRKCLDDF